MKKVLIITYYWPPAGGPGVQRWLKFVKYLPDFNIHPIIYIPKNPTYPIIDQGLLEEIPKEVTILKQNIIEPYALASIFSKKNTKGISSGIIPIHKKQSLLQKIFLSVRGNVFVPDARVLWVKPSVKYLSKYIKKNNIDTIITTGPPHSLHLIGLQLKEKHDLKWLADFRDPWTTIGYHKSLRLFPFAEKKHEDLERKVLNSADIIIVTSPTTKKDFKYITNKPIEVITNGFDESSSEKVILDKKFTLAHIGSFLSERNPRILWESLRELLYEIPEFKKHFQLKLIGEVSKEILGSLYEFNLDSYLNNMGYLSHQEAVYEQKKSQVLLIIEIDSEETVSIIPGKLFEYMVSNRPIIGIGPKGSDFAEIINENKCGFFCNYQEKNRLKNQILTYYNLFLKQDLNVQHSDLQKYSRKNLTAQLSKLLLP